MLQNVELYDNVIIKIVLFTGCQLYAHLEVHYYTFHILIIDCLCGLVVRVPGYISRGPGSIPSAIRFSEK
jgi:hypothetical protein